MDSTNSLSSENLDGLTLEGLFKAAKLEEFLDPFKKETGAEDLVDLVDAADEVSGVWPRCLGRARK